ncbi:MAG: glycoside hydrolase family protein [Oceanicaulis sp.]
MKPRLKSTRAARDLIKAHEPFHGEAVRRGKRWVVGYGHTAAARSGQTITREDAELLLIYDVLQAETAVHAALGEDLPGHVRDALVSFAASVGLNAFKVSDVARLAKAGRIEAAANALESWVRAEEDGRLVTSRALVERRAAEKALMLGDGAAAPAPQPEPEPEAPAAAAAPGPLIDVDIAFEEPEEPATAAAAPVTEPEPAEPEASPVEPEAAPEPVLDAHADPEAPAAPEAEALAQDAEPETSSNVEAAPDAEPEQAKPEATFDAEPEADAAPGPDPAVKASQDAAIQAVMSRMAGEIARSVSVTGVRRSDAAPSPVNPQASDETAPADEPSLEPNSEPASEPATAPARDYAALQLGYSFLHPAVVGLSVEAEEHAPQVEEAAESETPEAEAPETAPAMETPGDAVGEAAGPGRAVASPAPGPVYATVSVGPIEKSETAPPHPAEAPAPAAGMSGESEGPDHAEEQDHDEAGEDEAELEPAIVAGPEAVYVADVIPPDAVERRGQWVHPASLVAGAGFIALGGWVTASKFDELMANGVGDNWAGPFVFALGVLMLVSSGWVVIGNLLSKKR